MISNFYKQPASTTHRRLPLAAPDPRRVRAADAPSDPDVLQTAVRLRLDRSAPTGAAWKRRRARRQRATMADDTRTPRSYRRTRGPHLQLLNFERFIVLVAPAVLPASRARAAGGAQPPRSPGFSKLIRLLRLTRCDQRRSRSYRPLFERGVAAAPPAPLTRPQVGRLTAARMQHWSTRP